MTEKFKLLLPAGYIPDGSAVSKRTGEVQYTLKRSLRIYNHDTSAPNAVEGKDGTVFLVGERGAIDAYPSTTLLQWVVDGRELLDWLERRYEDTSQ